MKLSIKAVLFGVLVLGAAALSAVNHKRASFDGNPTPQCRPDGTQCIPSPR